MSTTEPRTTFSDFATHEQTKCPTCKGANGCDLKTIVEFELQHPGILDSEFHKHTDTVIKMHHELLLDSLAVEELLILIASKLPGNASTAAQTSFALGVIAGFNYRIPEYLQREEK